MDEAVAEAYADARLDASSETDLDEQEFPVVCPYSLHEIMERAIDWPPQA